MEDQSIIALLKNINSVLVSIPEPFPMFLEDGTVGVFWRRGKYYISIDLESDGEYSWAGTDGIKYLSGSWKVSDEPLPPVLLNELRLLVEQW